MTHIYIIEFENGLTKVGRSSRIKERIKTHQSNVMAISGSPIKSSWVSEEHYDTNKTELCLVNYCRANGEQTSSREWFRWINFDEAVKFAESINKQTEKSESKKHNPDMSVLQPFEDAILQEKQIALAYRCAVSLQNFINDSLWVSGDIFVQSDIFGHTPFVIMVGAHFSSGDPIQMLIDTVADISDHPNNEIYAVNKIYDDAVTFVKQNSQAVE